MPALLCREVGRNKGTALGKESQLSPRNWHVVNCNIGDTPFAPHLQVCPSATTPKGKGGPPPPPPCQPNPGPLLVAGPCWATQWGCCRQLAAAGLSSLAATLGARGMLPIGSQPAHHSLQLLSSKSCCLWRR